MKKLLLSVSALVLALGTGYAQTTVAGFYYDFTSTATGNSNCLLNATVINYPGVIFANGDGAGNSGVSQATDKSFQISSDANSTAFNSQSQNAAGYGQNPLLVDIYKVSGNNCASFRAAGDFINMSQFTKVKITVKASSPMRLRLELGKSFAAATNADGNLFEMAVTTSYQEFTFDYAGKYGTFDPTQVNLVRFKFNVGDPNAVTTGFTGTVNIASIKLGQAAEDPITTSTNADEILANQIAIYPNPATDKVTIDLSSLKSSASVKLLNTSGAVVSEIANANGSASFNVDGIAKGMYFVQINSDDKIIRKKIMVD